MNVTGGSKERTGESRSVRPGFSRRTVALVKRRLLQAIPVLFGILTLNFLILHLAPGDVVDVLTGEAGSATAEYVAQLRAKYGLDQPILVQLGTYIANAIQLDLGTSHRHGVSVARLILDRIPATLLLMSIAVAVSVSLGIALGVLAASSVGRPADTIISIVALLAYATPIFWLGQMLIVLFSVKLGWLPSTGMTSLVPDRSAFGRALDVARHVLLPATSLSLFYLAIYTRLMRASMLEIYGQDFIRTAAAKGAAPLQIAFGHALRNAVIPVVTMVGLQIGGMLGGSVLVETVFGWPGLGRLAFESVQQRDHNVLLGILFVSSLLVVLCNLIVDLLYAAIDPRIASSR